VTRHAPRLALAALVALVAGCEPLLDAPLVNRCAVDDDCASGRCDTGRGMCVATPAEPMLVGVEVVPEMDPFGGTPLPVSFQPIEVADASELDLELPLGVSVRGQVRSVGEPVSASVAFTLLSQIPGGPPTRIETQTFSEPMREGTEVFNYAIQLLPSRVYEVAIEPNGDWRAKLPPLRYRFESPPEGTRIIQAFDYSENLPRVRGVIVDAAGIGQPGLLVRAVEPVSGRVVSSTYTTGTDATQLPGHFEIVLAPGTESWVFSINASSSRIEEGRPSPTFAVDPRALLEGPDGVTILLPPVSEEIITYGGTVEVSGIPGRGVAASLTLTARDVVDHTTGAIGTFRATVTTDEAREGEFRVHLLPGTYEVVVTPTRTDLGVIRETVRLDPGGRSEVLGQVFQVPARARYGGRVQTLDALPIGEARVRGLARASTFDGALSNVAIYARSSEAMTDPDGQFHLPLDIGLYDVVVEPPSGTHWPWALQRDVAIGGADAVLTSVIELAAPVPLSGRATFVGGRPVAGAEVRAYALVREASGTRTIEVGRARTDADGRYTVLLPSRW
jgi:hypothetical protein